MLWLNKKNHPFKYTKYLKNKQKKKNTYMCISAEAAQEYTKWHLTS